MASGHSACAKATNVRPSDDAMMVTVRASPDTDTQVLSPLTTTADAGTLATSTGVFSRHWPTIGTSPFVSR